MKRLIVVAIVGVSTAMTVPVPAQAATGLYANCSALHRKYPHGLGRSNATDKTSGRPVTTFTRDTRAYNAAMKANRNLDRDNDGIACEKR